MVHLLHQLYAELWQGHEDANMFLNFTVFIGDGINGVWEAWVGDNSSVN